MRLRLGAYCFCHILLLGTSLQAQWQVGASSASISPAPGAFIAGHTLNRRFTGVHDDLFVKALAVSDGRSSVVILTFDCIGLLYPQLQQIRQSVATCIRDDAFDASRIVMSSTHTHAGPDVVGLWGPDRMQSGVDTHYMKKLVATASEQVLRAWEARVPARAAYAVSTHGEGWVYNISRPAQLDQSLTTLRFLNAQGRSLATLTNFACHPTILDGAVLEVSSDYIAGFYQHMDSLFGGVNLFLQGAIGGWVQPEHEPKQLSQALFRGRGLAEAVRQALATARPLSGRGIFFASQQLRLHVENPGFRLLAQAGVIRRDIGDSVETEVAVFRVGDACFATHPGESIPEMSHRTRALLPKEGPSFVLGLGMDALGYILDVGFFSGDPRPPHADYLCSMSVGPATAEAVMKAIASLAARLR
ncbi:MAG: alkaline ceramidase [Bacteroidetes bacterium]|nr:alkaline ceramidase [Bacteroidota bacterium]